MITGRVVGVKRLIRERVFMVGREVNVKAWLLIAGSYFNFGFVSSSHVLIGSWLSNVGVGFH